MSGSIISTKKQPVIMGHICSNCGCPVLSVVKIEASAQKSYSFSQKKAQAIASQTADLAIEEEIKRIESCKYSKTILASHIKKSNTIALGHYYSSAINGFDKPCPNCINLEPWQSSKIGKLSFKDLTTENYPRIFRQYEDAEKWAIEYNKNQISLYNEKRTVPENVTQATTDAISLYQKIDDLYRQRDSMVELIQCQQLNNDQASLIQKKTKIGLLDFKRRKIINDQIQKVASDLKSINQIISQKKQAFNLEIVKNEVLLQKAQPVAFGCTGYSVTREFKDSIAFIIEAVAIPKDKLTKIKQNNVIDSSFFSSPFELPLTDVTNQKDKTTNHNGMSPYCPKCGFKLLPGSKFCSKCGIQLSY